MAKTAVRPSPAPRSSGLVPIPQLPGKPIVGNMLDFDAKHPIRDIMEIAKRLGPIFQLDMMGKTFTIVWGFELVDELCDEKRFDKSVRGALQRIRKEAGGGDGLFTAYTHEPNWSRAHNILLPNFSDRAMQSYHPSMLDIATQMMLKWERMNPEDEIDVSRDMTALTLDTIGLCGFGFRFNSFYRDDNHPFVEAMVQSLEGAMKLRGVPFEDPGGRKLKALKAHAKYMETVADQIVTERKHEHAQNPDHEKRDLLDYMLDGVDKKSGTRLDDINIRRQMLTFLIAGHETTSGLLSFCIYYLLNNPEVARKATEEVDRVFGTDTSVLPSVKEVNQLTYVQQVLKETLRLWPTAPAFAVAPYENEVLGGKYALPKNSHTMILLPMLHRDPSVWGPRAEAFDPDEHFSPEAEAKRPVNAFKAFGNGQRACIGSQFAMQEATLVIGMVLQRFRLIDHKRYQLQVRESLTVKPENFKIRVQRRPARAVTAGSAVRAVEKAHNGAATTNGSHAGTVTLAPPPAIVPQHGTPLLVLYGSNLGSSEDFARHIAETGIAQGFDVTIGPLDDYVGRLPTSGAVTIVTASYNGTPPDNAAAFYEWLSRGLEPNALAGVKYSVFGAGNRNWASTYQSIPRAIDEMLAKSGAQRIHDRGEGDARDDLDASFEAWKGNLWPAVSTALGIALDAEAHAVERPMYAIEFVAGPQPNPLAAAHGAVGMRVLVNRELQSGGERSTRHVEVALPPGSTYRTGDHLGVLASNPPALVERVLRRFGFDATTYVRLHALGAERIASLPLDATLSVRRLLTHYVELQGTATRKHIATLAEHTRCPNTGPALRALADDPDLYREQVRLKHTSVLDLLEKYPACELDLPRYLLMLPLMAPRYYSISSSPRSDAERLSITVGVVREPAWSGTGVFEGVASNHIARREPGTRLFAFVKESKSGFTLPSDPKRPIIMVGPGTGLAPFRGFLAERAALRASGMELGPAMLFFGCRHPERDYLYRSELEAYAAAGIVDLNVAFSRYHETKTYVQDLIGAKADVVWHLLQHDAVIFVCGDGGHMEPQVRERFAELYRANTASDEAASSAWLDHLTKTQRYVLDVWATS